MLGFADKPLMTWAIDKYYKGFLVSVQYAKHDIIGCDKTMTIKGQRNDFDIKEAFLDPLFWQALGKAEGWEEDSGVIFNHRFEGYQNDLIPARFYPTQNSWQFYQHEFIDYIAEGKDIDYFFNKLIKGK